MTKAYEAWREKEAYAVPMTDEGLQQSVVRWNNFKAGWDAAVDEAVLLLQETQQTSTTHNYFIVSAQIIKVLKDVPSSN